MANPITNLFSKKQDVVAPPALKALITNVEAERAIKQQISAIAKRVADMQWDIRYHEEQLQPINALRKAMSEAEAEDLYHNRPARDLSKQRAELQDLEQRLARTSELVRKHNLVLPKLQADVETLGQQRDKLRQEKQPLVREAALETAESYAVEYLAAKAQMEAIARKVYAALLTADTLTKELRQGRYGGSAEYTSMLIPLPPFKAFIPNPVTPWQANLDKQEDLATVSREAEALFKSLSGI